MVKDASVTEAHEHQRTGAVYVDVRSRREFAAGHPSGAVNVPLMDYDEDTGQPSPNGDFVRVIRANFAPDARLLIGCQVGGRSQRAAQMLEASGFTDITNVRGGFGGFRDRMSGRLIDAGWEESGLPVETGEPDHASYAALARKADDSDR